MQVHESGAGKHVCFDARRDFVCVCVCACVYWLPAQCVERCCVPGNRMSLCLGFILLVNVSRFSPWGLCMPLCLLPCVCVRVCVRIPCRCACLCVSGLFQKFWQKWTCLDQACAVVYNGSIYTHIDLMLKVDHLPVFSCSAHACRHTSTTHMQTVVSSTCRYTQEKEDKAHHPLADSSQAIELNTHLRGWSHVVTVQRKACPGFLLP